MNIYDWLLELADNVQSSGDPHWTPAGQIRKLQLAYKKAFIKVINSPGSYLLTSTNLTPSSGVITLPSNFGTFAYMEEVTSGNPIYLDASIAERRRDRGVAVGSHFGPKVCHFVGNTLEVNNYDFSDQVTLWYNKRLIMPHTGTCGSSSGSNVLELESDNKPSPEDNFYNGVEILITSGTYIGTRATVTDYTGSTFLATISGTFNDGDTYTTVNELPEECDEFIIMAAAKAALAKPGAHIDDRYYEHIRSEYVYARKDLDLFLSSRTSGSSRVRTVED